MNKNYFIILGNGVDWCELSLREFAKESNVHLINNILPIKNAIKLKFAKYHYCHRSILVSRKIWYKTFLKTMNIPSDYEVINVIIYDHNFLGNDRDFINYLREYDNRVKIYYMFTNIVKYSRANELGYVNKLNDLYDSVFAFDKMDSLKYQFDYSPLIYDATFNSNSSKEKAKAFYVGQAKDRFNGLINVFEKLNALGIDCDFYIVNVDEDKQKYKNTITYNKFITYQEALDHINNATCLIDLIQGDSTGLTIKTCEAVCYDKKLITTNKHVKDYPFYNPKYIKIIDSSEDIDISFFEENKEVHYTEEDKSYFSYKSFLKKFEA